MQKRHAIFQNFLQNILYYHLSTEFFHYTLIKRQKSPQSLRSGGISDSKPDYTSSIIAISAASPRRGPILTILV